METELRMTVKLVLVTALLLMFSVVINAQPGSGGPITPTPIDGGVGLLIAAGIAMGVKEIRHRKK